MSHEKSFAMTFVEISVLAAFANGCYALIRQWTQHQYLLLIPICLIPFTVLLYSGLPSDIEHFLSCGANNVLLKPLDTEAFGKAMKEIRKH